MGNATSIFRVPHRNSAIPAAGPQLTDDAEQNLVLAFQLDDDSTIAYDLSELVASDSTEPYLFSAASVTAAGPTNDATLRDRLLASATVKAILVDRTHINIDADNLQTPRVRKRHRAPGGGPQQRRD